MDIHKAGGVLIRDRKLLVGRSHDKEHFVAPGGKVEPNEFPLATLIRELKEEFDIIVLPDNVEELSTFYAPAAGDPTKKLRMDVFIVRSWDGELTPRSEIKEMAWINSQIPKGMKVGSIFEHGVIPFLQRLQLID